MPRGAAPQQLEEEEGPASPPEWAWSGPMPMLRQGNMVHPLGQTTSAAAGEGSAKGLREGRAGKPLSILGGPETLFSEYQLCFQAQFEAIQKCSGVYIFFLPPTPGYFGT